MTLRNLAIWGVVIAVLIALYTLIYPGTKTQTSNEISYSQLLQKVDQGEVKTVILRGDTASATDGQNRTFTATTPTSQEELLKRLEAQKANIKVQSPQSSTWVSLLVNLLPVILLVGAWVLFMRQMQGAGKGAMGFGKSKARLLTENKNRVTFEDVAGVD